MAGKSKPDTKHELKPKLRFPEFRDAGDWQEPSLGDLYTFKPTNTYSRDKLNYESGSVKNIHYGDIHTKFSSLFDVKNEHVPFVNESEGADQLGESCFCEEGDMVFADASEDLADVGKSIELVALNGQRVLAGTHTILATRKSDQPVLGFGGHLFQCARVRAQIKKEAQGSKVYGISAGRISGVSVCMPPEPAEQTKIAACLSSLDELIAAESRKLEALQAHKKGLMQQLFPREGETLPRLRFPEFKDAGEWKEERFGDLVKVSSGKGFKAAEYSRSGIQLLQIENVGYGEVKWNETKVFLPDAYEDEYPELILREGDIVLALNRPITNNELKIAKLRSHDDPSILYQRVGKIERISDKLAGVFVYRMCEKYVKDFVKKKSIGSDQPFIALRALYDQDVRIPFAPEQQKIEALLSPLDNLIRDQANRLSKLDSHKKGLMQQLFPSLEDAHA